MINKGDVDDYRANRSGKCYSVASMRALAPAILMRKNELNAVRVEMGGLPSDRGYMNGHKISTEFFAAFYMQEI